MMKQKIFINIGCLVNTRSDYNLLRGADLKQLPTISNAYLLLQQDKIFAYGQMNQLNEIDDSAYEVIDVKGAAILPSWCDCHSHIVFAQSREEEFIDKINGLSYTEIAAKGGGILNSALKLSQLSEEELFQSAWVRLRELISLGTGALEIKSGYGLSLEGELKMLSVIKKIKQHAPIPIRSTFLGAHAFPEKYKNNRQGYIKLITEEMIPLIAGDHLADFIDVFCEDGFFSPKETLEIISAGKQYGLQSKIHTNQFTLSGGVEAGVSMNALSVDHLELMDEDTIELLAHSNTIGVLLPGAAFFLSLNYPRARDMINAGCAIALGSDFNPGSCPSGNMNLVLAMACIKMKMLPEEAINAATINAAYAMGVENEAGSITSGKKANFIITKKISSPASLPYFFGSNLVDKVYVNGQLFVD